MIFVHEADFSSHYIFTNVLVPNMFIIFKLLFICTIRILLDNVA